MNPAIEKSPTMRPYPWKCPECRQRAVRPLTIPHDAQVKHDNTVHEVHVDALPVHRCDNCGAVRMDESADIAIRAQLRKNLDLLAPEEIRASRLSLGLTQEELGRILGFAGESVSRWERGVIQSRSSNNLLEAFFEVPAYRERMIARDAEATGHAECQYSVEFEMATTSNDQIWIDPVIEYPTANGGYAEAA